jgi:hypothetical protein
MASPDQRDQWLQDIDARQRNLVFPNTTMNEVRFWRNLGTTPSNLAAKIGLAILAIFVFGLGAAILIATFKAGVLWFFLLGMLLFCGSIFGSIVWATRRSLQKIPSERHSQKIQRAYEKKKG